MRALQKARKQMSEAKGRALTEEEQKALPVSVSINFETTIENLLQDTGVKIAEITEWSPTLIIDIFQLALEDANAHSFNEALTKLRNEHDW